MRKKVRRGKSKSNKKLIILAVLVLLVGIGFAALQRYLTINGSATIDSTWDVRITDISKTSMTGGAYERQQASYTETTATFDVGLRVPDDSITYAVKVQNNGSLNAKLDSISVEQEGSENITYEVTGIQKGDILAAYGSYKTVNVTISYSGTTSENLTKALTVKLLFVQTSENTSAQQAEIDAFEGGTSASLEDMGMYYAGYENNKYLIGFGIGDGGYMPNCDIINADTNEVILADAYGKNLELTLGTLYNLKVKESMIYNGTKVYSQDSEVTSIRLIIANDKFVENAVEGETPKVLGLIDSYTSTSLTLVSNNTSVYTGGFLRGSNVTTVTIPEGFDLNRLGTNSLYTYNSQTQGNQVTTIINRTGNSTNWAWLIGLNTAGQGSVDCTFETGTCASGNTSVTIVNE